MESALYGIFTLVGFVSEISLVRCAHSFDFRYFTNSCENPVRTRFPWSNLYMFTVTPFEQTLIKSFSVICVNRTITLNVVRRKPSQITEWSFFSLVFIVYVHSPVLIGSFHSRQRSRSWNFWKRGLIWKSLTSDPTQTPPAGYQGHWVFNWPFRGTKHTVWEEGAREAAFVWTLFAYGKWSKLLKQKGVKNKEFLHVTDCYPTLINLVGED